MNFRVLELRTFRSWRSSVNINFSPYKSTSKYGRLEVWRESSWGTVCDEGFDENDAQVACHDLGFRSVGWLSNHYKVKMNSYFKSSYKNYIKHIILRLI